MTEPTTSTDPATNAVIAALELDVEVLHTKLLAASREARRIGAWGILQAIDEAGGAGPDRDLRVLADEVTRLSAITGQLRALAGRWQATVRPGETHPAAAAILGIIDGNGPSVREAAADDRAHWTQKYAGEGE